MYKNGDPILIKATVKYIEDVPQGNMIRCITADSGEILWCSPNEVIHGTFGIDLSNSISDCTVCDIQK